MIVAYSHSYGHHYLGRTLVRATLWHSVGRVVDRLPFAAVVAIVALAAALAVGGWVLRRVLR